MKAKAAKAKNTATSTAKEYRGILGVIAGVMLTVAVSAIRARQQSDSGNTQS